MLLGQVGPVLETDLKRSGTDYNDPRAYRGHQRLTAEAVTNDRLHTRIECSHAASRVRSRTCSEVRP